MSRLPTHTLDSAPPVTRPVLEALAQRSPTPGRPINLHAQMAHAPAVLLGYVAMRKALDDHGTLDRKSRTAILLAVAAADGCAYTVAVNTLIARQAGWSDEETRALRHGDPADRRLAALLGVARQSARTRGSVDEATWQAARGAGWSEAELAETFAFVGLTQYVDAFVSFAQTELDPALAQLAPAAPPRDAVTASAGPQGMEG
jgi:AhpD family alkylhydroperoxidase